MKIQQKDYWYIVALLLVLLVIFTRNAGTNMDSKNITTNGKSWIDYYKVTASSDLSGYQSDVSNTQYYDYNDPAIAVAAEEILKRSSSATDAMQGALDYVNDNIQYNQFEGNNACTDGTAPKILVGGIGQCDTQSITLIALLRKMGIAAKPAAGCVLVNSACGMQALYLGAFQDLGIAPKYTPLDEQANVTGGRGGRNAEVLTLTKGGLHAWVTAWDDKSQSWKVLEATNGRFADTNCHVYHVELFPTDSQKSNICRSYNDAYISACRSSNLEVLNQNGLGIMPQVTP